MEESRPDVVLMDVRMLDTLACGASVDGIGATRHIKARWPQVKVIVLSMYPDYAANVLEAKADAFVSKRTPPDELLVTLAAVTVSAKKEESP